MKVRSLSLVVAGVVVGVVLTTTLSPHLSAAKKAYVRLATPRIAPIEIASFTPEQRAAAGAQPNLNLRTALYEPELGKRWWSWLTFVWNADNRVGSALTLYDNIQRLKLDVQTIAPFHGGRTTDMAELTRDVQK